MNHKQLIEVAYKWVLNRTSCGVAFKEFVASGCREIPDVIGFASFGYSVLVECKASRSDFLADRKKFARLYTEGLGRYRFYCCPTGLIKVADLPERWGLIYVTDSGRATCVHNPYNPKFGNYWQNGFEPNMQSEMSLMYSALRRLHKRGYMPAIYLPEKVEFEGAPIAPDTESPLEKTAT